MPVKIVKINSETFPAIADAIRAKTGSTDSILPSQMAGKIANIPTGGELPVLSSPAKAGHVVAGKEYIDATGNKQTGTMVICDSVNNVGTVGEAGIGVHVQIESTVDKSSDVLTLQDPNFKPENIKSGISIFDIAGSVKEIRTETGTITPAEDSDSLVLPCTANPKMFVVQTTDASLNSIIADNAAAMVSAVGCWKTFPTGKNGAHEDKNIAAVTIHMTSGKLGVSGVTCEVSTSVTVGVYSTYRWKAGVEYKWTAYYWDDNA